MTLPPYFQRTFWGNTLEDYLFLVGILLLGILLKRWVSNRLSEGLYRFFKYRKYEVGVEEFIGIFSAPIQFLLMVIIVFLAFKRLDFPIEWHLVSEREFGLRFIIDHIYRGLMVFSLTWLVLRTVDYFGLVLMVRARRTESRTDDQVVPFLKEGIKVALAGLGFMILLAVTFDLDIVSLVTGLGIGGLAFALAAKETLENLLGSFTIFLDKPFLVGDLVKVGTIEGTVESIGFRSTRIRSIDRMLVTLPNKKMVDAELINDTNRRSRRCRFTIGLRYDTPVASIRELMESLRGWLTEHPLVEPVPTVFLHAFGASSIDIQVTAIFAISDRDEFAAEQERILFHVLALMEKYGCEFAFPTTTVVMDKGQ